MEKRDPRYAGVCSDSLKEELVPAMGCTEADRPGLCSSQWPEKLLGEMPDRVVVGASGSIIKNVKSVIVPNTGHLKGIPCSRGGRHCGRRPGQAVRGNCHV